MRQSLLFLTAVFVSSAISTDSEPFSPPLRNDMIVGRAVQVIKILKRQTSCPSGYDSCSSEGDSGACCASGTTCTQDAANNIACCPTGALCTGVIAGSAPSSGQLNTGQSSTGQTSSSGFQFPQPSSSAPTTSASAAVITGSTIPGGPYPFVYIPTSFGDAATCMSYYSQCQTQYSSCTASLGGVYGVTVGGSGGGVTVQGASPVVTAAGAAQSICSSLSSQACYGLQTAYCDSLPSGSGGSGATSSGQFITPSNNARRRSSSLYDLAIGFAAALAGMLI